MRRRAYVLTCLLASTACATAPQNALAASYFDVSNVTVDEGAGAAGFLIRRVSGVNQRAVVRVATRSGTAIGGSDYVTREETLTFLPGERSKPFSVPIIDDSRKEARENFTVTIRPVSNARLYSDGVFVKPGGRAHFANTQYKPTAEKTDARYPLHLLTGRRRQHGHDAERTHRACEIRREVVAR